MATSPERQGFLASHPAACTTRSINIIFCIFSTDQRIAPGPEQTRECPFSDPEVPFRKLKPDAGRPFPLLTLTAWLALLSQTLQALHRPAIPPKLSRSRRPGTAHAKGDSAGEGVKWMRCDKKT